MWSADKEDSCHSVFRFFGCAATRFLHPVWTESFLCLRVLTPVVAVTEECKNTDNKAHHHKQGQGDPEKTPTQRNLGTKPAEKDQDLLHPPVKRMASHCIDLIFSLLSVLCVFFRKMRKLEVRPFWVWVWAFSLLNVSLRTGLSVSVSTLWNKNKWNVLQVQFTCFCLSSFHSLHPYFLIPAVSP